MGDRHGNARQRAPELDLTRFDPAAETDFLLRRQEMDLADLLEVQANRILGRGRARAKGFG
jgi:hypothetical protein